MITVGKRGGETGVAVMLGGVSLFLMITASRMPLGTAAMPGPGVMPLAIGGALAATSAALLLTALRRKTEEAGTVRLGSRHILVAIGGLAWISLALEGVGFLPCFGPFLLVLAKLLSRQGWIKVLAYAGSTAAIAYWFFAVLLDVNMPRGPF